MTGTTSTGITPPLCSIASLFGCFAGAVVEDAFIVVVVVVDMDAAVVPSEVDAVVESVVDVNVDVVVDFVVEVV